MYLVLQINSNESGKSFNIRFVCELQTLFYTLPRLSSLIDDEWIPTKCFSQTEEMWSQKPESMWLPLLNKTESLQDCTPGSWRHKTLGKPKLSVYFVFKKCPLWIVDQHRFKGGQQNR